MGLLSSKPKVEGEIGFFGLADWWLSTFTEQERRRIETVYQPLGGSHGDLTKGKIETTSQTAVGLLSGLAAWFEKPNDYDLAHKILSKAWLLIPGCPEVLDIHFAYQSMIEVFYRNRDTHPEALPLAIKACEEQIAMAPAAAKAFPNEPYFAGRLPAHKGYLQLAVIREKEGDYQEAKRLSQKAQRQGWDGDWQKRIERCQTKLQKSATRQ